jgi:predicted O-methyltransferase YrrM
VLSALNAVVEHSGELLEGNYCHRHHARVGSLTPPDPRRSWKREYLRRCVGEIRTLLEVGFNAGHSAAIALLGNPDLDVVAVDLARHSYTRVCAEILSESFPGRIVFHWGDSTSVLDSSEGLKAAEFGLVHIDGGHSKDVFRHDLNWWISSSQPGSKLLVDDAYVPHIKGSLEMEVVAERIRGFSSGLPSSGENQLYVRL